MEVFFFSASFPVSKQSPAENPHREGEDSHIRPSRSTSTPRSDDLDQSHGVLCVSLCVARLPDQLRRAWERSTLPQTARSSALYAKKRPCTSPHRLGDLSVWVWGLGFAGAALRPKTSEDPEKGLTPRKGTRLGIRSPRIIVGAAEYCVSNNGL